MKNLFNISGLFLFVLLVGSCNTDHSSTLEQEVVAVQQRTTNWCDGGATPDVVTIVSVRTESSTGYCCIFFRFTTTYAGKTIRLTTTDYNFITMTGDPGDNHMYTFSSGSGYVEYCFPQQGSHFLIEVVDGNGITIACVDFPNQC